MILKNDLNNFIILYKYENEIENLKKYFNHFLKFIDCTKFINYITLPDNKIIDSSMLEIIDSWIFAINFAMFNNMDHIFICDTKCDIENILNHDINLCYCNLIDYKIENDIITETHCFYLKKYYYISFINSINNSYSIDSIFKNLKYVNYS